MNNKRNEKVDFLLNHPAPTPLNFYIKFGLRGKLAANSEYKKRLKQAIECDPSLKKLLELEKKLVLGHYKNDWTSYDDWRENNKANVCVFYYKKGKFYLVQFNLLSK